MHTIRFQGNAVTPRPMNDDEPAYVEPGRNLVLPVETMRVAMSQAEAKEEKLSMFWRVFGGAILSVSALIVITVYQSLAASIHELRNDQNRLRELLADAVKKDEFSSRHNKMWDEIQKMNSLGSNVTVLSNKLNSLDEMKKTQDQDHKDLVGVTAGLQAIREKDVVLDKTVKDAETERRELVKEIQALRERVAKLEGSNEAKPPKPAEKKSGDS